MSNSIPMMLKGERWCKGAPKGMFGLEIEMEGVGGGTFRHGALNGWSMHEDGSLQNGIELVFSEPCDLDEATARIANLNAVIKEAEAQPRFSIRTSVHVHVNCIELSLEHTFNFIFIYWLFEDILSEWCGEDRKGNMFCLRRSDSDFMEQVLLDTFRKRDVNCLFQHGDLKYSAMNVMPLSKFGSIEFRMMRGTLSPVILKRWLNILLHMRKFATTIANPSELVRLASGGGIEAICEQALGPREKTRMAIKDPQGVMRNLRQLQYIIYEADWASTEEWKPVAKVKKAEEALPFHEGFGINAEVQEVPVAPAPRARRGRVNMQPVPAVPQFVPFDWDREPEAPGPDPELQVNPEEPF